MNLIDFNFLNLLFLRRLVTLVVDLYYGYIGMIVKKIIMLCAFFTIPILFYVINLLLSCSVLCKKGAQRNKSTSTQLTPQ